jgi:hypothetical protein
MIVYPKRHLFRSTPSTTIRGAPGLRIANLGSGQLAHSTQVPVSIVTRARGVPHSAMAGRHAVTRFAGRFALGTRQHVALSKVRPVHDVLPCSLCMGRPVQLTNVVAKLGRFSLVVSACHSVVCACGLVGFEAHVDLLLRTARVFVNLSEHSEHSSLVLRSVAALWWALHRPPLRLPREAHSLTRSHSASGWIRIDWGYTAHR